MNSSLPRELSRFQRRWQLGLFATGLLAAAFWAGLALLVFGLIDYLAGFSDPSRHVVSTALGVIGGAAILYSIWALIVFVRRSAAREADRALGSSRREVLSALELSEEPAPATPLAAWLRHCAVETAAARLHTLPDGEALPREALKKSGFRVLLIVLLLIACFCVAPAASRLIGTRLLNPEADVPPYSPLHFAVGPHPAQVLYGSDLVVSADITGGEISGPVRVLTRDPTSHRADEAPAYRETEARYSQKLEKVSAPLEVAFAVGRARSAWLQVQVRTQPKVQEVVLTIEPPAYTHLPRREFAVGTQPLAVLAGSRITARVASNRPLSAGTLQLFAGDKKEAPWQVAAELEGANRLRFTWIVRQGARLGLTVRDVLNTASEPLEFEQKLIPDQRPEVALREPAGDVLATPDSELPLEYSANDDLGLSRLALVRKLGTYRERSLNEPLTPGERRQEVRGKLSLTPFGLVPGQVIELSAEAADTNPTLLGVATSETARVRIISREDYAEMLRQQTTLEDFTGRYEAIEQAIEQARTALAELEKAAESGDPKKAEEARQNALEAHQEAAKLFGQIAKDFPIFDLDPKLSAAATDVMTKLFENAGDLESLAGKPADQMALAAPALRERLGKAEERIAEDVKKGERAAKAGAVIEEAQHFRELLQEQRDVVKDLNRVIESVRRGEMTAAQALPEMQQRQQRVAEGLEDFEKKLGEALKNLPEEFGKLRAGAEQFLQDYRETPIPPIMQEGAVAAGAADGQKAGDRAGEALARMEAIARKKNSFCQMMEGEGQGEGGPQWPDDLAKTMRELMEGLCHKPGNGPGKEGEEPGDSGAGPGGHSPNGYVMRGRMRQLPIYGPNRTRMASRSAFGVGSQAGRGGGDTGAGAVQRDQTSAAEPRKIAGESVAPEAVPEAYREAVKRYFLPSESNAVPSPKTP